MLLARRIIISFASHRPPVLWSKRAVSSHLRTMKLDSPEFRGLFTEQLKKLAVLFEEKHYELRIAGGAVRDLLMGIQPADVDFATTATPTEMKDLFESKGIRMLHKRGEEHGTITCRLDDCENFEITTLRIDVVCDGRRAEVKYTTDWELDANRRDLTINSMFLGLDGTVYDYFGGINDVENRQVAFVGDPVRRIQEDYLRILRYFRFFGRISSSNEHDEATIKAIIQNRDGLKGVSPERIWTELKRIVIGRKAPQVVRSMLEVCELNELLGLPKKCNIDRFDQVFEMYNKELEPMTMISSLCKNFVEIAEFHSKTKLSNAERFLAEFIMGHRSEAISHLEDENLDWFKDLIIELHQRPGKQKHFAEPKLAALQLFKSICMPRNSLETLATMEIVTFPVTGVDLMNSGVKKGPIMKNTLEYLFDIWQKSKYSLTTELLLKHAHDEAIPRPAGPPTNKRKSVSSPVGTAKKPA